MICFEHTSLNSVPLLISRSLMTSFVFSERAREHHDRRRSGPKAGRHFIRRRRQRRQRQTDERRLGCRGRSLRFRHGQFLFPTIDNDIQACLDLKVVRHWEDNLLLRTFQQFAYFIKTSFGESRIYVVLALF